MHVLACAYNVCNVPMYLCTCVCFFVCIYGTYTYSCLHMHVDVVIHIHTYINTYAHALLCIHTHIYIYIYIHIYIHMYTFTHLSFSLPSLSPPLSVAGRVVGLGRCICTVMKSYHVYIHVPAYMPNMHTAASRVSHEHMTT